MLDTHFWSAKQLASAVKRRKIGCLELLEHYLKRVERHNPALNAIIATDLPAARQRAGQPTARSPKAPSGVRSMACP